MSLLCCLFVFIIFFLALSSLSLYVFNSIPGTSEGIDKFLHRFEFLSLYEIEFQHEEDEMLEGGIEMGFGTEFDDLREVRVVDMGVDAEKSLEYGRYQGRELLLEGHSNLGRENCFVIELFLHPGHQVVLYYNLCR